MQDGFLSMGPATSIPGALEGEDSDHLSPCPLLFLQFVTNCSSGHISPIVIFTIDGTIFTIDGTLFPCRASVPLLCNSPHLSPLPLVPGPGESPGSQAGGEPLGFWNIRFAKDRKGCFISLFHK